MFDHGEGPWGDDPPFHNPVFVLTHETREPLAKEGGTTFTFVAGGSNVPSSRRKPRRARRTSRSPAART
jgi:hypothetical protein